jgi:hypothetical protein
MASDPGLERLPFVATLGRPVEDCVVAHQNSTPRAVVLPGLVLNDIDTGFDLFTEDVGCGRDVESPTYVSVA